MKHCKMIEYLNKLSLHETDISLVLEQNNVVSVDLSRWFFRHVKEKPVDREKQTLSIFRLVFRSLLQNS